MDTRMYWRSPYRPSVESCTMYKGSSSERFYTRNYMRSKQEYSIGIDLTSIFRSFSESLLRYPGKMSRGKCSINATNISNCKINMIHLTYGDGSP